METLFCPSEMPLGCSAVFNAWRGKSYDNVAKS